MIIQCEQCQTRFKVADDKFAKGPIRVRCSKCSHVFTASGAPAAAAAPAPPAAPATPLGLGLPRTATPFGAVPHASDAGFASPQNRSGIFRAPTGSFDKPVERTAAFPAPRGQDPSIHSSAGRGVHAAPGFPAPSGRDASATFSAAPATSPDAQPGFPRPEAGFGGPARPADPFAGLPVGSAAAPATVPSFNLGVPPRTRTDPFGSGGGGGPAFGFPAAPAAQPAEAARRASGGGDGVTGPAPWESAKTSPAEPSGTLGSPAWGSASPQHLAASPFAAASALPVPQSMQAHDPFSAAAGFGAPPLAAAAVADPFNDAAPSSQVSTRPDALAFQPGPFGGAPIAPPIPAHQLPVVAETPFGAAAGSAADAFGAEMTQRNSFQPLSTVRTANAFDGSHLFGLDAQGAGDAGRTLEDPFADLGAPATLAAPAGAGPDPHAGAPGGLFAGPPPAAAAAPAGAFVDPFGPDLGDAEPTDVNPRIHKGSSNSQPPMADPFDVLDANSGPVPAAAPAPAAADSPPHGGLGGPSFDTLDAAADASQSFADLDVGGGFEAAAPAAQAAPAPARPQSPASPAAAPKAPASDPDAPGADLLRMKRLERRARLRGVAWQVAQAALCAGFLVTAVVAGRGGHPADLLALDFQAALGGRAPAGPLVVEAATLQRRTLPSGLVVAVVTGTVTNSGSAIEPGARVDVQIGTARASAFAWSKLDGIELDGIRDEPDAVRVSGRVPASAAVSPGDHASFVVVVPAPPAGAPALVTVERATPAAAAP